ncbi:MAG: hypothetical protein AABY04_03430 [Candidatus Micrarchaeota archaeon]
MELLGKSGLKNKCQAVLQKKAEKIDCQLIIAAMHLIAARLIPTLRFLNPKAVVTSNP